jgi:hypothetical protein
MDYSFNIEYAEKYGVNNAITIQNLLYWIFKNKANNKHYYDNNFWTYNSVRAFKELFPFWTARQIEYILNDLVKKEIIIKGNYNKNKYDHTLWYAFKDPANFGIMINDNKEADLTKNVNLNTQNVPTIPDNKPDNKPDIKADNKPDIDNNILELYNLYPNKDILNNRNTNKNTKLYIILNKLLKKYSFIELRNIIALYIINCYITKTYIKNYKTFLNDIPNYETKELEKINNIINNWGFPIFVNNKDYEKQLDFIKDIFENNKKEKQEKTETELKIEIEINELNSRKILNLDYDKNRLLFLENLLKLTDNNP